MSKYHPVVREKKCYLLHTMSAPPDHSSPSLSLGWLFSLPGAASKCPWKHHLEPHSSVVMILLRQQATLRSQSLWDAMISRPLTVVPDFRARHNGTPNVQLSKTSSSEFPQASCLSHLFEQVCSLVFKSKRWEPSSTLLLPGRNVGSGYLHC